ncbi:MAG: IclR family transcriptional regulator [Synergistota bacterium]|nr:IclR family transcriptional regulator [Synergistota bacterium]
MIKTNDENHENGTQSIERALSILNCFTRGTDDLSLTEISKLVDIPYSTASRIAGILEKESFLHRDVHSKRFSLGRRVYSLGYCAKQNDYILKVAYPYLVNLRDEFGETALVYVREGDYRILLEKVSAFHNFKFSPTVGSKYVIWAGAGGRGFLAFASPEEQTRMINESRSLTPYTTIDRKNLMRNLYVTCKYGYCFCANEYQEGFSSIAGPIIDNTNSILCTIAVTGPSTRFTENIIAGLKERIPQYCLEISKTFGWTENLTEPGIMFKSPSFDLIVSELDGIEALK